MKLAMSILISAILMTAFGGWDILSKAVSGAQNLQPVLTQAHNAIR